MSLPGERQRVAETELSFIRDRKEVLVILDAIERLDRRYLRSRTGPSPSVYAIADQAIHASHLDMVCIVTDRA